MMTWRSSTDQSRPRYSRTRAGSISSRPGASTRRTAGSRVITASGSTSDTASATASASSPRLSSTPTRLWFWGTPPDPRAVIGGSPDRYRFRGVGGHLGPPDVGSLHQRMELGLGHPAGQVDEPAVGRQAEVLGLDDVEAGPDPVGDPFGGLDLHRLHVDDAGDEVLLPATLLQGHQVAGALVGDLVVEGVDVDPVDPGEDGPGPGGGGVAFPQRQDVLRPLFVGGLAVGRARRQVARGAH